ncbi:peptidase C14, caspase domain-containing protein [Dichotomocladium elegans]|nr:peptidase C14, caspase domain-containing protein [Dichotomocladium elegans]
MSVGKENEEPLSIEDSRLSCNGKKRALLIGINYFDTENALEGCINDVHNVKDFIVSFYGFSEQNMKILTDDQKDPTQTPTRANILAALQWLVEGAEDGDSFFLHYSGHGGFVEDDNGDEPDGFDETIFPVDFDQYEGTTGQIRDDDLHQILVLPLPAGCRLTAIFDSCHSGTVLDLPYIYSTKGELKETNLFKSAGKGILSAGVAYARGDKQRAREALKDLGYRLILTRFKEACNRRSFCSPADIVMFSGCKDDQTSADDQRSGKATGAMSYAFITALRNNPNQSYRELLNNLRDILGKEFSQRPQLSSSHPIDVDAPFIC